MRPAEKEQRLGYSEEESRRSPPWLAQTSRTLLFSTSLYLGYLEDVPYYTLFSYCFDLFLLFPSLPCANTTVIASRAVHAVGNFNIVPRLANWESRHHGNHLRFQDEA